MPQGYSIKEKMMFTFMIVGDKLYRMDLENGNTWYADHAQWIEIKEPVATA